MTIACVVEGKTEFYTVPKIIGRLGHYVTLTLKFNGGNNEKCEWETLIRVRVLPRVLGAAEKNPDKILVVLDREGREECSPELAIEAVAILEEGLRQRSHSNPIAVVVCDRKFENLLMADSRLVDKFKFLTSKFSEKIGDCSDGKNVVKLFNECCNKQTTYDKLTHGIAIAQQINLNDQVVLARSRSLQKLVKELS